MSQIFDVSETGGRKAGVEAAAEALAAGRLVAMPTETVYGLAADATNARAVASIFAAKGRPSFNPLIVHVGSLAAAENIARLPAEARRLAERFWPGPLTLVLHKRERSGIADLVTAGLDTIALRIPAHAIARDLLTGYGRPLAAPSANRSGHVSATTAEHVAADLGGEVAVILDAGPTTIGLESTIVGFASDGPVLLRSGGLDRAVIEATLGQLLASPKDSASPSAPGMLASHYAPKARLRLEAKEVRAGEAVLAFGPEPPVGVANAVAVRNLSETGDLVEAAANLFAALRELDLRAGRIAVMPIPYRGLGEAINDRLKRAAAPRGQADSLSESRTP